MLIALVSVTALHAQTGFYVPKTAKVYFSGGTATIFSDVNNQGQLGVGRNAQVNFSGNRWVNDPGALITDESNNGNGTSGQGGMIRFIATDTGGRPQQITAGYNAANRTGPVFSNLTIANPAGIQLLSSSMKVRRWLNFAAGTLDVNSNILVIGNNNPGQITGYNDTNFVITGPSGGFLLRERITSGNGKVIFPVGTAAGHYTPAAILVHNNLPDDFYVRVSDSVKAQLTSGQDIAQWSVGKTWQIGQMQHPGEAAVDITLQHQLQDEGQLFTANRGSAYVSQYTSGSWDIGYPQSNPKPGTLTTGAPLTGSGMNTRSFQQSMSQSSYFTKLAGYADTNLNRTNLWFSAYRTDRQNVYVYWTTKPEIRNRYFVVQRRFITDTAFSNRDTVPSKAVGGVSFNYLEYNLNDPNSYGGTTFYRLMMVDYNGNITYSNIIAVGGVPDAFGWTIWPNPTAGRFFVGISRPQAVKEVVIWDALGRLIYHEPVNNRGVIEMHLFAKGAYVIGLVPIDGDNIVSKKLIVAGD
jgi:hypothetical protein